MSNALKIGQRVRVSKASFERGVPIRSAKLVWSTFEGEITVIKRGDINLMRVFVSSICENDIEINVCICMLGPKLDEYGQKIEILEN